MIKALVAVRGGSERVKNKNMRAFAGSSLLELKVSQLLRVQGLDGVVVNSEDDEMLDRARNLGAETVKRDPYYASSSVVMSDVYVNMAEHMRADVIMYANVTNPLVRTETYEKAIREYLEKDDRNDSLNSATLQKLFLWRDGMPVNYDPSRQPRSQDLPDIYSINFAISLISREHMIQYRNVVGRSPYLFQIDAQEGLDIDTELDFEVAEYIYARQNRG